MSVAGNVDESAYQLEHALLIENILPLSVSRSVFTVFNSLKWYQKEVSYDQLFEDLGTYYSIEADEFPEYDVSKKPILFDVPAISAGHSQPARALAERRAAGENVAQTEKAIQRQALKFANDEDMYAIAGENTVNGIVGMSDTTASTGFSEAADTELDLTSFATLKTTLNGLINQLNSNMNASSGSQTVKQYPLVLMVTSDVEERLWELESTLVDGLHGFKMASEIIEGRGGSGSKIVVSNSLGGTVTKSGNRFTQSTDGTTNAILFPSSPQFQAIFASPFRRKEKEDEWDGLVIEDEERWRLVSFKQDHHIYSGTVDITA